MIPGSTVPFILLSKKRAAFAALETDSKDKTPDALRLSGLHTSCNMLNLQNL